ncbi:MAG TPA: fumarylacetoacetase [Thermoanaerobaculia bacterium]|nr:fumarylacetoacetase [Thermoanaerobaculia bacterium]
MSSRSLDRTHDPARRSWVESANRAGCDFPIQNLPYGVFSEHGRSQSRIGAAIGDRVLDLTGVAERGLLDGLEPELREAAAADSLNALMALDRRRWRALRSRLVELLSAEGARLPETAGDRPPRERVAECLLPASQVETKLPARVGDYTDFYASIDHATNVGSLFRPDNPLLPNYKWLPIGYHGRASSLVVSGTPVRRPSGQRKPADAGEPSFGPCRMLDYELEVGFFVGGAGNALGERVPIEQAEERIFGLCLVNDWSARDLQAWEYQPLGPFLAKSFATSLSPWVVTLDALAPFRCPAFERAPEDPGPLDYLAEPERASAGIDITVEVALATERARAGGGDPFPLSRASFAGMYWTIGQMLAHHASNGCPLVAGDLMASGTVSGPEPGTLGSLLEITRRGQEPLELPDGETRGLLEDGDEVVLRGRCEREGAVTIGFGQCRGVVVAAS